MSIKVKAFKSENDKYYDRCFKTLTFRYRNPFTRRILKFPKTKKARKDFKKEGKWLSIFTFSLVDIIEVHIFDPNGGDLHAKNIQRIYGIKKGRVLELHVNKDTPDIGHPQYISLGKIASGKVIRDFGEIKIFDVANETISRRNIKWIEGGLSKKGVLKIHVAQHKPF